MLALLLMALSAFGGYRYGRMQPVLADTIVVKDTVYVAEQTDSVDIEELEAPAVEQEEDPAPVAQEEPEKTAEPVDKYAAKDERVRLGAYRIVGTAQEVTIQQGQTFYSICRAYLGPDMECYVEVYNDLPRSPQLKAGQVIKIPKLELKKRRR